MSGATRVVQDAGKPLRPSTSTRHRRQDPKAFSESVAQSFGMWASASAAARMIEVPAGTVTLAPSISSVTESADFVGGVPRSRWSIEYTLASSRPRPEVLREVLHGALHGEGGHAPEAAQGRIQHRIAELLDQHELAFTVLPAADGSQGLRPADRADPAGRALAAGFDCAEFHRVTRHLQHVHGVVECDDAAVPEQGADRGKGFVFERRVELRGGQVGAERPADLYRADGAPAL